MREKPYWWAEPIPPGNPELANTVANWHQSDSETHYQQIRTAMPREWWGHGLIEYSWNSLGYRGPEITSQAIKRSVVITGCSHVVGHGLAWEQTIGQQLSRRLGVPVINLGVSGSSPRFAAMLNWRLRSWAQPRAVINIWSDSARLTHWGGEVTGHLGPWNSNNSLYYEWNKDPAHCSAELEYTRAVTRALWPNTQYLEGTVFKSTRDQGVRFWATEDRARDLGHIGPVTARLIAEDLARELIITS